MKRRVKERQLLSTVAFAGEYNELKYGDIIEHLDDGTTKTAWVGLTETQWRTLGALFQQLGATCTDDVSIYVTPKKSMESLHA